MVQKNFFLTGLPGAGKTTVITRLAQFLGNRSTGFYTAEIRTGSKRQGFEVVTLSGKKAILAHVDFPLSPCVGRYGVKPESLKEAIAEIKQAIAQNKKKCLLIDEIGKMELFAPGFQETVQAACIGLAKCCPSFSYKLLRSEKTIRIFTLTYYHIKA